MKLYGLKDDQGRDVELTISDEGHPHHHVLKVEVIEEKDCKNCKHGMVAFMDYPCAKCIEFVDDGVMFPLFEARKPAKD